MNLLALDQSQLSDEGRQDAVRAIENPVHLSPITVSNALPRTVQLSTTQFLDESYTAEKYIFSTSNGPFILQPRPEQSYARVEIGGIGKELDDCGI